MKNPVLSVAALIVALTGAFLAGAHVAQGAQVGGLGPALEAQGINPLQPNLPPLTGIPNGLTSGPVTGGVTTEQPNMLVYPESGGSSASSNGFLAVTGSYGVGTSVLYVIDTETRQLAVYEARGGSRSMRRLTLVGARKIDLDLQLRGYNDESEYPYGALEKMFEKRTQPAAGPDVVRTIEDSGEGR